MAFLSPRPLRKSLRTLRLKKINHGLPTQLQKCRCFGQLRQNG